MFNLQDINLKFVSVSMTALFAYKRYVVLSNTEGHR